MLRLFLLSLALTGSYRPVPGPRESNSNQQDSATQEQQPTQQPQRVTDSVPVVVPIPPSQLEQVLTAQETDREQGEPATNWWLVGFTFLLVVVGAFQVRLMYLQKASSQRQLRAYLSVSEAWLKYPLNGPPVGWVRIVNSGQTPASDVRATIQLHVGANPGPVRPLDTEKGIPLAPGGDHKMATLPDHRTIDPTLDSRTIAARHYLYGIVAYRDAFGAKQTTTFRFKAIAELGYRGDMRMTKRLALDGEGNDAT